MPQQATLPSTADAFLRAWRRQCKTHAAKWDLLVRCSQIKLRLWFKSNLPADVISDILVVCGTALQQSCSNVQQSGNSGHPDMPVPQQIKAGPSEQEQTASVPLIAFGLLDGLAGDDTMSTALTPHRACLRI